MSNIQSHKSYCSFCRKELSKNTFEQIYGLETHELLICLQCKDILKDDDINENMIVLFNENPVLQTDAKVLNYFEKELNLPLPPISLNNFLTDDEVYGYLIEDNYVVGLGLDGSGIESLSAIILNLQNLKFLSLKNNSLAELPDFINKLVNLEIIDLTKNNLLKLPSLTNLDKLNHLVIRDNLIDSIDSLPENLQSIQARWNRFKHLPKKLPKSIKRLNFAQNRLLELPTNVGELEYLEELNLYGNNLKVLPESIINLKKLIKLILRVNKIEKIPKGFSRLESLTYLDLEENLLRDVPNLSLLNLKYLNLSKNSLEEIPGLEKCIELENLDIRDNKIQNLDISNLNKLKLLDFSYNEFDTLINGIGTKSLLIECIASGNRIKSIDSDLKNLKNLVRLSLAKNKLSEIPDLSFLTNLQELYLNDNNLTKFPNWIKNINLRVITLGNNQFDVKEEVKESQDYENLDSLFK